MRRFNCSHLGSTSLLDSSFSRHCPKRVARSLPVVVNIAEFIKTASFSSNLKLFRRQQQQPPEEHVSQESEKQPLLAHEIIYGDLTPYSTGAIDLHHAPTAVLVHGALGCRRNMHSFAYRLIQECPSWQVLLVDLRCHGDSTDISKHLPGPHNIESAAADIHRLLSDLKLFPEVLIGHSISGKVVMSLAKQYFSEFRAHPHNRPIQIWALDALPGQVNCNEMDAADRPIDLISTLMRIPLPIRSREDLIAKLEQGNFSSAVIAWAASSLKPADPQNRSKGLVWSFDLDGVACMYQSYEQTDMWPMLMDPPHGAKISFVKAEQSMFTWGDAIEENLTKYGHKVHVLENSGHWVHIDNPEGLFEIMKHSFGRQ